MEKAAPTYLDLFRRNTPPYTLFNTESEKKMASMLDSISSLVVVTNLSGEVRWVNRAAIDLVEKTDHGHQYDSPLLFWNLFSSGAEDQSLMKDTFCRIQDGELRQHWFCGIEKSDGEYLYIEWFSSSLPNYPSYVLLTGLDVTNYHNYNERLIQQLIKNKEQDLELAHRIAFENLITSLSTKFITLEPSEIDDGILNALQEIAEFTGDDRSWVILYTDNATKMANTHEWAAEGLDLTMPYFHGKSINIMPWINNKVLQGEVVHLKSIKDLPLPEAEVDKQLIESDYVNNKSDLFVPMINHGEVIGCLGFDSVREEKSWNEEIIVLLRIVGEMITNLLERKQIGEALRESRQTLSTLISNLPGMAYKMKNDRNGTFEFVSDGCLDLIGYKKEQLLGSKRYSYIHHVHPDDRKKLREDINRAIDSGQPYITTHRVITKDHEIKWVWEQGRSVMYPNSDTLVLEGFITDSTDRMLTYQKLEEYAKQRTREIERRRIAAEGMQKIVALINADTSLKEVLDSIVEQVSSLLSADKVALFELEQFKDILYIQAGVGLSEKCVIGSGMPISEEFSLFLQQSERKHLIVNGEALDNKDSALFVPDLQKIRRRSISGRCRSMLLMPLVISGDMSGALLLFYSKDRTFSNEDIELITTLSYQAELAIKNTHLRLQAEENAKNRERSRIARDLHDSVTQTLFSALMVADTIPVLMKDDPEKVMDSLEQLQFLEREALSEMRTLLLEMRTGSLKGANLEKLLQSLSETYRSRSNVDILLTTNGDEELPADIQIYLYRITQESLTNVLKHSHASKAKIVIDYSASAATLVIRDDGCGFDPEKVGSGHFGLSIMKERTATVGASMTINSNPGKGTEIVVNWPSKPKKGGYYDRTEKR